MCKKYCRNPYYSRLVLTLSFHAALFSYHGFDKLGRPLYIEKTGRVSPDFVLNYFRYGRACREEEESIIWHPDNETSLKLFTLCHQQT
jgi:hypothetical protein